ncbi:hypothetical protein HK100_007558 [Physocladia obscura]|uniref:Uncharacterized protein n=1 Tax=Physocladia obscura TaxID=109957 RepID=A0AAD5TAH2_9FUNG|nr:hypothetical protein HK100_007558 [Physocladia obscura]
MSEKKSMRLSFKGDQKPKKKRKTISDATAAGHDFDEKGTSSVNVEGWAPADIIDHFMGPIMILSTASACPSCLVTNEKTHAVALQSLYDLAAESIDKIEPVHVGQVFLASRLPTGPSRISIKSAFDRYLSCDKFGVVTCETEAVGPYEEWEVVKRPDGFALQSVVRNGYLSAEVDGINDEDVDVEKRRKDALGKAGFGVGGGRICGSIRADADGVGFREVFQIRCQVQNKINAHKKKKKEMDELNAAAVDADQLKKFQSYGRTSMTAVEEKLLRRAQKQGNLNETLLERREKIKADRYCK